MFVQHVAYPVSYYSHTESEARFSRASEHDEKSKRERLKSAVRNAEHKVDPSDRVWDLERQRRKERKKRKAEPTATETHCNTLKQSPSLSSKAEGRSSRVDVQLATSAEHSPRERASSNKRYYPGPTFENLESTARRKPPTDSTPSGITTSNHFHSLDSPTTNLNIKTMRPPSPQLEHIATAKSPQHIRAAVSTLLLLQARARRLQTQISSLETESKHAQASLHQFDKYKAIADAVVLKAKLDTLEELALLASRHWYEVFELECSLRDVIDEESGTLEAYMEMVKSEFEVLVKDYDARIWEVMVKGCPQVAQKTVLEIADARRGSPKEAEH